MGKQGFFFCPVSMHLRWMRGGILQNGEAPRRGWLVFLLKQMWGLILKLESEQSPHSI